MEELTQAEDTDQDLGENPGENAAGTLQLNLCPGKEKRFCRRIVGSMSPEPIYA